MTVRQKCREKAGTIGCPGINKIRSLCRKGMICHGIRKAGGSAAVEPVGK